mgnify:CR=1 FL=1
MAPNLSVCNKCSKTFTRNDILRRHAKKMHPGIQLPDRLEFGRRSKCSGSYSCKVCSVQFSRNASLRRHAKQKPSDTLFVECLKRGRKAKPQLESDVTDCTICHKKFRNRQHLYEHKRLHHIQSIRSRPRIRGENLQKMEFDSVSGMIHFNYIKRSWIVWPFSI